MEQYNIPVRRYFKNIRKALKQFRVVWLGIRFMGSQGGERVISENMGDKKLTIKIEDSGLCVYIDKKKVFFYEITNSGDRWSIAYERFDNDGHIHQAHAGYPNCHERYIGPDDPELPEVKNTILRSCNCKYLIEIIFSGKIPIKNVGLFLDNKYSYYWEIDT